MRIMQNRHGRRTPCSKYDILRAAMIESDGVTGWTGALVLCLYDKDDNRCPTSTTGSGAQKMRAMRSVQAVDGVSSPKRAQGGTPSAPGNLPELPAEAGRVRSSSCGSDSDSGAGARSHRGTEPTGDQAQAAPAEAGQGQEAGRRSRHHRCHPYGNKAEIA